MKFDGWWYQADQLGARAGQRVWIESGDIWGGEPRLGVHEVFVAKPASRWRKKDLLAPGDFITFVDREPGQETVTSDEDEDN